MGRGRLPGIKIPRGLDGESNFGAINKSNSFGAVTGGGYDVVGVRTDCLRVRRGLEFCAGLCCGEIFSRRLLNSRLFQ